jgi:hypothetical protein
MSISDTTSGGIGQVYVRKEGLFHIYTDRIGSHGFFYSKAVQREKLTRFFRKLL